MKVKDLIAVSTADYYKIIDCGKESVFNLDRVSELLALFGEREIYVLTALTSDALEIIVKQDGDYMKF